MSARILIADDKQVSLWSTSKILRSYEGWEVCAEAENGQQALSKAVELKPDVVILDLAMPVMNGLQAASEIGKVLPSVPIVLYTLYNLPPLELEAKRVGVRQVVSKPDSEALFKTVQSLLADKAETTPGVSQLAESGTQLATG